MRRGHARRSDPCSAAPGTSPNTRSSVAPIAPKSVALFGHLARLEQGGVSDRSTLLTSWCDRASECPRQAKSWGWEVSGVAAYLRRGLVHDTNLTDACRTQYSSAVNGTDSPAMLPKPGTAATHFWS